jgi:hypothetical protein
MALSDEPQEFRPKMSFVGSPFSFPRRGERLAGAGAGPDGPGRGPPSEFEGEGPPADSGEEMGVLGVFEVVGLDIDDAPLIHRASGQVAGGLEIPQPLGRVLVPLVVEVHLDFAS